MIKADIDALLEATTGLDGDINHLTIDHYEIDLLLEVTEDW